MAGFTLSAEQERLVAAVGRVAREALRPLADAGEPGRVNRPLLAAMGRHGLLARLFPGVAGTPGIGTTGAGADAAGTPEAGTGEAGTGEAPAGRVAAMDLCLLRETLAQVSTEAETALALKGLGAYPILQAGGPAVVRRWLPPVASGEAVAAFALSEPGAGSDAAALELRAEPDGDGWRLSGSKLWISNAPDADVYTVFARTTPGAGSRGVSAFVVAGDSPGLSGEPLDLVAPHAIGRLDFDAVPVRPDELLGEIDRGFRVAMGTLDLFRPSVGAFAVGMAQAALDAAVEHARTRRAFGATLGDLQAVAHMLADMATSVEASRLLVYAAASAYDRGDGALTARSAMAKLHATEAAQRVVDAAIQIHGARALQRGHLLEHLYREVRAPRIYEGASEVQRTIIGRAVLRREGGR